VKFTKRAGVTNGRPYHTYREMTREDFRRFCAYCFRFEDEVGGSGHFDQDHFEPNAANDGARERDYSNLYWCCKECNGKQNKGDRWPTAAERTRGEVFCDSCDHDPEERDYANQSDHSLRPITPAGGYTIRVLRLNERSSLRELRATRRKVQAEYHAMLKLIQRLVERAQKHPKYESDSRLRSVVEQIRPTLAAHERFVETKPFVLTAVPEPFDSVAIDALVTEVQP
jgi:hypothetical protein